MVATKTTFGNNKIFQAVLTGYTGRDDKKTEMRYV